MNVVVLRLVVAAVSHLSPSFVRLRLEGQDLALLHDGGPAGLRDTRVKLVIGARKHLGSGIFHPQTYREWYAQPVSERGVMRTYTIAELHHEGQGAERRLRAVDVDVLLTDHPGPGVDWVRSVPVGDVVVMLGPGSPEPGAVGEAAEPVGLEYRPGDARDVVLVADATALPAVRAIAAAEAGSGRRVRAVVSVPCQEDQCELGLRTDWVLDGDLVERAVELCSATWTRWVRANEARCGTARKQTEELPEVDIDTEILWETPWLLAHPEHGEGSEEAPESVSEQDADLSVRRPPYFWVAGEAAEVVAVRRAMVRDLGVPREQVAFMGYWRRGRSEQG